MIQLNQLEPKSSIKQKCCKGKVELNSFSKDFRLWDNLDLHVMGLFIPGEFNR
jgi:hypothetical protein